MALKIQYVFIVLLKDFKSHLQEDFEGLAVAATVIAVRETADGIQDDGCLMEVNLVLTVLFKNFLVSVIAKILFPLNHCEDRFRCFLVVNSQNCPEMERKSLVHYF